jgi:hypothetical protein
MNLLHRLKARLFARSVGSQVPCTSDLREELTDNAASGVDELTDAGMTTAEYAVGTVAACAFAAVLYKVVTSAAVLSLLSGVVTRALNVPF